MSIPTPRPCIFIGCVSTDRHWHGGFPGGYDNPADPDGPPIEFTSEPLPGVRDYNGALLAIDVERLRCGQCGDDLSLTEIEGHLNSEGRTAATPASPSSALPLRQVFQAEAWQRTTADFAQTWEQPDPILTYTDPAGGPDWEPRGDEA